MVLIFTPEIGLDVFILLMDHLGKSRSPYPEKHPDDKTYHHPKIFHFHLLKGMAHFYL